MQQVIDELYQPHRRRKAVVATDVGQHQMWAAQFLPDHDAPLQLAASSGGAGTMGFGFPAAIGAQFARPDDTRGRDRPATAASQMTLLRAGDRCPPQTPPQDPRSSTTTTSAWSASGRSSSSTIGKSGVDLEGNPRLRQTRGRLRYGARAVHIKRPADVSGAPSRKALDYQRRPLASLHAECHQD